MAPERALMTNTAALMENDIDIIASSINSSYPMCPIRNILARIGSKWSLLVLYTLAQAQGPIRFRELQRAIADISQKMLTNTLRILEEDGLVSRRVYAEVPPKVEYSLTQRSQTLLPHLNALINWARENMDQIIHDRMNRLKQ